MTVRLWSGLLVANGRVSQRSSQAERSMPRPAPNLSFYLLIFFSCLFLSQPILILMLCLYRLRSVGLFLHQFDLVLSSYTVEPCVYGIPQSIGGMPPFLSCLRAPVLTRSPSSSILL